MNRIGRRTVIAMTVDRRAVDYLADFWLVLSGQEKTRFP
jgi:hypothetical protein